MKEVNIEISKSIFRNIEFTDQVKSNLVIGLDELDLYIDLAKPNRIHTSFNYFNYLVYITVDII